MSLPGKLKLHLLQLSGFFFSLDIFALPVDTEDRLYSDGSLLCGYLQAYTPDT